jgi:hypothetical protein
MSIEQRNSTIDHMNYSPKCWTRTCVPKTLSPECINAIQQFQINTKEKECYLAFYVRLTISMSFDTMTTSPVESMNSSLKRGMGIDKNSNARYVNV